MKRAYYPRDAQAFDRDPLRVSRNLVAKGGIEPPRPILRSASRLAKSGGQGRN